MPRDPAKGAIRREEWRIAIERALRHVAVGRRDRVPLFDQSPAEVADPNPEFPGRFVDLQIRQEVDESARQPVMRPPMTVPQSDMARSPIVSS